MESFDIADAPTPPRPRRSRDLVWNVLTILVLLTTLCVGVMFLVIFINPQVSLNPFPPPTDVVAPIVLTPTPSSTPRITMQPSWTPTSALVGPTSTPRPTNTPLVTDTPSGLETAEATFTPGGFTFVLGAGSPSAIPGAGFHPGVGCDWTGVAGQATSLNGEPVRYLFVQLGGTLGGQPYQTKLTMTGTAPQYGQGGFEFTIAERLVASSGTLWIQLLDQANLPLSDKIYFSTLDDCEKNLIIIYFQQAY